MKYFIVSFTILLLLKLTPAQRPLLAQEEIKKKPKDIVVEEINENDGSGKFYSLRVTLDGARHEQVGFLKKDVYGIPTQVIQGRYVEITPDGPKTISYVADKTGYHPVGDHLPLPPTN